MAIGVATATIAHATNVAAPLHRLVQLEAREGQVTSKGSRYTILQSSGEEGT